MRKRLVILAAIGVWTTALMAASSGPAQAPQWLSQTGWTDARNRPFSPQYPLWTDGAAKRRWVHLPAGTTIDVSDTDGWTFPVGTTFWKEFAFGGRKVETRMLWKAGNGPNGWVFASYVWNDTQTDAELAPAEGIPNVAEVAPGKWHSIPSALDCRACHEGTRIEVLGFSALQLSTDRDPNAPHAEPLTEGMLTLKTLVDENRITPRRADWLAAPPRIAAENPQTRAVLGYLSANCGHCHNAQASIANGVLDLRQLSHGTSVVTDAAVARRLNRATAWQIPGSGEEHSVAVKPGSAELSALLQRMRSRRPSSQMPPLGTVTQDAAAVDLVTKWIQALPSF